MSDDLTDRLRAVRHYLSIPLDDGPTTADLCHEAADEIDRLRDKLIVARNLLNPETPIASTADPGWFEARDIWWADDD